MTRRDKVRGPVRAAAWGLCSLGLVLAAQAAAVPAKAIVAQALLERAFNQGFAARHPARHWPWADTEPVARISVARLGVRQIVLAGGSNQALAFGPTVVAPRTPGAKSRTTVVAAHRDTHFRFIRELAVGDVVGYETIGGTTTHYRVTSFQTVRWDRFAVPADPARKLLALATCYPFEGKGRGPWRRVAWAEAID
jgi:sortase A